MKFSRQVQNGTIVALILIEDARLLRVVWLRAISWAKCFDCLQDLTIFAEIPA